MKVMKINTLIITILKIKIEDSTLIVLIFKCIQYIDQRNPVFSLDSSGGACVAIQEEKKNMFCKKSS